MKKFISWVLLYSLSLFLFYVPAYATDADQQDQTVTVDGTSEDMWVTFTVTLTHTNAATSNVASQAIRMEGLDLEGATMQAYSAVGVASRDVNLIIQGSNVAKDTLFEAYQTRLEFDDFSPDLGGLEHTALLDRAFFATDTLSNATTTYLGRANSAISIVGQDSLGDATEFAYVGTDPALRCKFIRVVSDGQTSNPATASTTVVLRFHKTINPATGKPYVRFYNSSSQVLDVD